MTELSFKVGDLLIIETGEYSDKSWSGPVRMLVATSKQELSEAFRVYWKRKKLVNFEERDRPAPDSFLPWLIKTGRAEQVECSGWHVGSYGDFEP